MKDKNYSWKGSPNAGLVLSLLALVGAVGMILIGIYWLTSREGLNTEGAVKPDATAPSLYVHS